jgi:hypothetical protein
VITILVTDRDLEVVGAVGHWTKLNIVSRFNEPGSGMLEAPARPEVMALLEPGNRVVVVRDGDVYSAGPIEVSEFRRSVSDEDSPGKGYGHVG